MSPINEGCRMVVPIAAAWRPVAQAEIGKFRSNDVLRPPCGDPVYRVDGVLRRLNGPEIG